VSVVGKGSKPRSVVVYGPARAALAAIAPTEPNAEAFVFTSPSGRPLHRIYCVQIIRRSAKRAGITKKVSCHWFRHSHASHALDHRAPLHLVSATLGHANLATTGRYLHCRPDESAGKYLVV
jgi:integrase/recombinase XerD